MDNARARRRAGRPRAALAPGARVTVFVVPDTGLDRLHGSAFEQFCVFLCGCVGR